MENLLELERKIKGMGWFSGKLQMIITLENEFEGFSGRATETWESRVIIEIKSPDESKIKSIKVVGGRLDTIDDVAKTILKQL